MATVGKIRTIVNWEAKGVPARREGKVRRALRGGLEGAIEARMHETTERAFEYAKVEATRRAVERERELRDAAEWALRRASDHDLLDEVMRRLRDRQDASVTELRPMSQPDDSIHTGHVLAASEDDLDADVAAQQNET